jgi:hypothetical protein
LSIIEQFSSFLVFQSILYAEEELLVISLEDLQSTIAVS